MPNREHRNVYGIFLMLTHSLAASMLYAVNKYLTEFMSSSQVVFLYKLIVLVGILPWVIKGGLDCLRTTKLKLHIARGFVSTVAALCFFYGLKHVDIASATALNKMEPVLLMIVGVMYFKEKLSLSKVATVIISFIGMIFITYPIATYDETGLHFFQFCDEKMPEINYNYLIILCAVLLWTINSSIIKSLGKTESNRTQLFYVSLISVLVSLPVALFQWDVQSIAGIDILWISAVSPFAQFDKQIIMMLVIVAIMHFTHVTCYFQSLKVGELSVVVPFDYSRLVIGGLLGYYFFDVEPSFSSAIGYVLIMISGVYLLRIQTLSKRKKILLDAEQS